MANDCIQGLRGSGRPRSIRAEIARRVIACLKNAAMGAASSIQDLYSALTAWHEAGKTVEKAQNDVNEALGKLEEIKATITETEGRIHKADC